MTNLRRQRLVEFLRHLIPDHCCPTLSHEICYTFFVSFQKKLQETQHTLADLEEKHRQAITTIKEKEFLISNLLKSGKLHPLCLGKGEIFWLFIWLVEATYLYQVYYFNIFITEKLGMGVLHFSLTFS